MKTLKCSLIRTLSLSQLEESTRDTREIDLLTRTTCISQAIPQIKPWISTKVYVITTKTSNTTRFRTIIPMGTMLQISLTHHTQGLRKNHIIRQRLMIKKEDQPHFWIQQWITTILSLRHLISPLLTTLSKAKMPTRPLELRTEELGQR